MNMGWTSPPKYTPRRRVSVGFLHEALRAEHAACRHFYTTRDEQLLGHVVLADPFALGVKGNRIGAVNLVQWLRIQAYHDAHHYGRVAFGSMTQSMPAGRRRGSRKANQHQDRRTSIWLSVSSSAHFRR